VVIFKRSFPKPVCDFTVRIFDRAGRFPVVFVSSPDGIVFRLQVRSVEHLEENARRFLPQFDVDTEEVSTLFETKRLEWDAGEEVALFGAWWFGTARVPGGTPRGSKYMYTYKMNVMMTGPTDFVCIIHETRSILHLFSADLLHELDFSMKKLFSSFPLRDKVVKGKFSVLLISLNSVFRLLNLASGLTIWWGLGVVLKRDKCLKISIIHVHVCDEARNYYELCNLALNHV
jgi:hypothetical protein